MVVIFLYKTNPKPRKIIAVGKSGANATFNLVFLGLGWPWVGELVGFIVIFYTYVFPTQQNLANHKHPFAQVFYHCTNCPILISSSLSPRHVPLCTEIEKNVFIYY